MEAKKSELKGSEKTKANKEKVLDALREARGIVSYATKVAGVGRVTHYDWMKDDPAYKAEVETIEEEAGDFVEQKLLDKIEGGDATSIIFYLKTKLKNRGYQENQMIDLNSDTIEVQFPEENQPPEVDPPKEGPEEIEEEQSQEETQEDEEDEEDEDE